MEFPDKEIADFSSTLLRVAQELKARSTLERSIRKLIGDFYGDKIDDVEFVTTVESAINAEITRQAYRAARTLGIDVTLRAGGIDLTWVQYMTSEQIPYIDKLADQIIAGKLVGTPVKEFLDRVSMWGQLSDRAYNTALMKLTKGLEVMTWELGQTKEHCSTCFSLNGQIATAEHWKASGYIPQGTMLECGGFHCQCKWTFIPPETVVKMLVGGWISKIPVA